MPKVLIVYYSRSGNTQRMAEIMAEAIRAEGLQADCKKVQDTTVDNLLASDAIIAGSPTYYGTMAAELKQLFDESVTRHGRLNGKVGAAFASSANLAGGNETTVLDILNAMLIHGMIIQGDPEGDHYGPVAIGPPDERSEAECRRRAKRVAELVKRLAD
ncbi:MAG: flavodoxin family protein [Gemmatimonadales bacterium]|nr:flavodoxin family protein [Gemmatimonadales bacterium]